MKYIQLDTTHHDNDKTVYNIYNTNMSFNPFSTTPAKTGHFSILLCLTADDFSCQGRSSGSKRVKDVQVISFYVTVHKVTYTVLV